MQIPPGSASASSRAAMLTPSRTDFALQDHVAEMHACGTAFCSLGERSCTATRTDGVDGMAKSRRRCRRRCRRSARDSRDARVRKLDSGQPAQVPTSSCPSAGCSQRTSAAKSPPACDRFSSLAHGADKRIPLPCAGADEALLSPCPQRAARRIDPLLRAFRNNRPFHTARADRLLTTRCGADRVLEEVGTAAVGDQRSARTQSRRVVSTRIFKE